MKKSIGGLCGLALAFMMPMILPATNTRTVVAGNEFLNAFPGKLPGEAPLDWILKKDTVIDPQAGVAGTVDTKVSISNGEEAIEFTPLSALLNGALIEPINRTLNKGVPTAFYLSDSSAWTFYTMGEKRLTINGAGNIITGSPLLINNAVPDSASALRVNGVARFDSVINLKGPGDDASFISLNNHLNYAGLDPDDGISPYTSAPVSWANGADIPVFRIRHPNTMTTQTDINTSLQRDFMIFPYQYGTAIEYNGVVECWVGEWSIHRGLHYNDAEGNDNGWGGVLWIGDDGDEGGVRATARNNIPTGGDLLYGELSVEKFTGNSHGDFRLRLPSNQNEFQFVYGARGSKHVIGKISDKGFFISKVSSAASIPSPEKGQVLFDSTDNQFKGFNGTQWTTLTDNGVTGSAMLSANGTAMVFQIAHGLNSTPAYFNVTATSADAGNISYVTADAVYLSVHYKTPPLPGTNNLSFNWQGKK